MKKSFRPREEFFTALIITKYFQRIQTIEQLFVVVVAKRDDQILAVQKLDCTFNRINSLDRWVSEIIYIIHWTI